MTDLNLAAIGNCGYAALIDQRARVCWACLPHFDGDPFFCSLLNGEQGEDGFGYYEISVVGFARSEQRYLDNTAILVTTLYDSNDSAVEIVDFAPRYSQFDRFFRPICLVRLIKPVRGAPRIRVRLRPAERYGAGRPTTTSGSNHIRYVTPDLTLRLTTDVPVSFIIDETPFVLQQPVALILGPDESLARSVAETAREFFEKTVDYWLHFTRHLSIPFEWQDAVIRAAITLKLCSFEDTGGIIAAMTTSIPEAPHSGRNWDYRYCWLRDAYFVVHALNRVGATGTLARFIRYISNLAAAADDGYLQPVYGINLTSRLDESEQAHLAGYRGMGPVRVGNKAYEQIQNDTYGSAILAVSQVFFDRRLASLASEQLFHWLEKLGEQAAHRFDQPDAGLWELRTKKHVHTFSSVMCWAACDRLARIANRIGLAARAAVWRNRADTIRDVISQRAWNAQLQRFVGTFDGDDADASLLLLHELGFVAPNDPRFVNTLTHLEDVLRNGNQMFRYAEDEFGRPSTSFSICTFWYIDALHVTGRHDEARELFEQMLARRNHVGLLSEDMDPRTDELWGNFPQTYSMVGLVRCATRLSKGWDEAI
jgi:GH15 family glucan-1,4-alpha-glucosidase